MRRAAPVLLAVLVLAATASAAGPTPPRTARFATGGHSLAATLVHTCLQNGAQRACTAPQARLHGSLKLRARGLVTITFNHTATSVTAGLQHNFTAVGKVTKAHGSGKRFKWTAPRSLGKANRLNVIATVGRNDSEFVVAIKRG